MHLSTAALEQGDWSLAKQEGLEERDEKLRSFLETWKHKSSHFEHSEKEKMGVVPLVTF